MNYSRLQILFIFSKNESSHFCSKDSIQYTQVTRHKSLKKRLVPILVDTLLPHSCLTSDWYLLDAFFNLFQYSFPEKSLFGMSMHCTAITQSCRSLVLAKFNSN